MDNPDSIYSPWTDQLIEVSQQKKKNGLIGNTENYFSNMAQSRFNDSNLGRAYNSTFNQPQPQGGSQLIAPQGYQSQQPTTDPAILHWNNLQSNQMPTIQDTPIAQNEVPDFPNHPKGGRLTSLLGSNS